jgi:pilus assembly protein CpaB
MNARRLISAMFIALLISGVFTFWLSRKFAKPHAAGTTTVSYVASTENLEAGEMLKPAGLKMIDWPATAPLQGTFVKPDPLVGRVVMYPVAAGEPLQERQLAAPGSTAGLTVKIPEGMRAISLKTDQVVGVAGFLLPGTYVDVLVTYHTGAQSEAMTSTVLQDVQILAAGQKTQPDPEGKATTVDVITLLVNPQDAEKAVLASTQGTVHYVLRNGADRLQNAGSPVQISQLGGAAPKAAPVRVQRQMAASTAAAPKAYSIETVSGGKQSTATFQ